MNSKIPIRTRVSLQDFGKLEILRNSKTILVDKPIPDITLVETNTVEDIEPLDTQEMRVMGTTDTLMVDIIPTYSYAEKTELLYQLRRNHINYDHISYIERLYIYDKTFSSNYPTEDISFIYWDIETTHKMYRMPDTCSDIIVSLCYQIDNNEPVILFNNKDDKETVKTFLNLLRKTKFDILVGFNQVMFDIPYLLKRANFHGLEWEDIFEPLQINNITQTSFVINSGGHNFILMDLLPIVRADQSLTGNVTDFKMKTVAKNFKINAIEIDTGNINDLIYDEKGKPKKEDHPDIINLKEYNKSDVIVTHELAKIYINEKIMLSELLGADLNTIMNNYSSIKGTIVFGRLAAENNITPMGNNWNRYGGEGFIHVLCPEFMGYQGAISKAFKSGLMKNIKKFDFSSMYPSAMVTLNLGPNTTRLTKVKRYDPNIGIVKVITNTPEQLIVEIPDATLQRNVIISIDRGTESLLKGYITKLFYERKELKKKLYEAKQVNNEQEKIMYNAQQQAVKVVLNSLYGYEGLKNAHYGDLPSALLITAFCRDLTNNLIVNVIKDDTVNVDTDGIHMIGQHNVDDVNKIINDYIINKYGITDSIMKMEDEDFWPTMYIYKAKNYIVPKNGHPGEYKKTGAAFKGSNHCDLHNKFVNDLADCIMTEKSYGQVLLKYHDLESFPITDFVLRKKVQSASKYKESAKQYINLATQMEDMIDEDIAEKAETEFIVIGLDENNKDYQLIETVDITELNYDYYHKHILNSILKIFGINKIDIYDIIDEKIKKG